jgi:hypothetical protein
MRDAKPIKVITKKKLPKNKFSRTDWIHNASHRIFISGSTGTGKSYFLLDLLPHMRIDELRIMSSTLDEEPYVSIRDHYEDTDTNIQLSNELDPDMFDIPTDDSLHTVVIIDDPADVPDKQTWREDIVPLFKRGRHGGITTIIIDQDFFSLPAEIRKNVDMFVLFRTNNSSALSQLADRFSGVIKPAKFKAYYQDLVNVPYKPLLVDINNPSERLKVRAGLKGILSRFLPK